MALKIESGQIQVRSVGGVPMQQVSPRPVDYVGPRAEAQTMGTMAQILDRMSQYAFGEAKTLRTEEGMQYAAQNPITPDQLEAAKKGDVTSLAPKGGASYFDQAVKKARSFELSSHFEVEGRNELAKLLSDIEAGTATSEQVSAKIATLTEGFGKTLSQIDAEAALKFRATMATHGNTVLNAAYTAELKRAKAQRMAKFDMDFDSSLKLLQSTIEQHPDKIDDMAEVFRQSTLNQAVLLGDAALQKEYSTKFETALRNAKVQVLTKHLTSDVYMMNPVDTLDKIRKGDVGTLSPVLQKMIATDFDSVAKVTANYMVAVNQRESTAKAKREAELIVGKATATNLLEQIFPLPDNDPKRKELISKLTTLPEGSVPLGTLEKLLDNKAQTNHVLLGNLYAGIDGGTINQTEQLEAYVGRGINGNDYVQLVKHLGSSDRRETSKLEQGISRLAGINTIPGTVTVIDPKGVEAQRRAELKAEALEIQAAAARDGKTLTTREVLDTLESRILARRKTEQAIAARKSLDDVWAKRDWIGGQITREKLPSLEQKAKGNKAREQELKVIRGLLDQAEGVTRGQ